MNMDTTVRQEYERTLLKIARVLPPGRVEQLVDFARFLEAQNLSEALAQEEDISEVEADNARWDALLATDESQALLEKLAAEALAEHQAGKTMVMELDAELAQLIHELYNRPSADDISDNEILAEIQAIRPVTPKNRGAR